MTDGFQCESGQAIVRRLSPMSGNSGVVGGVVGKTRKGLHEDGTGRQLDFRLSTTDYGRAIYTTTRRTMEVYKREHEEYTR